MDYLEEPTSTPYSSLIQTVNRFILDQTSSESDFGFSNPRINLILPHFHPNDDGIAPANLSTVLQLVNLRGEMVSICQNCGFESKRETGSNVIDLVYPSKVRWMLYPHVAKLSELGPIKSQMAQGVSFPTILQASINRETIGRMSCSSCRITSTIRVKRNISNPALLPPILSVNSCVYTSEQLDIWLDRDSKGEQHRFLKNRIGIFRDDGEGEGLKVLDDWTDAEMLGIVKDEKEGAIYELKVI
jgi:PAB-dependent poly(A)-specific ribonuclease subunit 2